jgi:ATP-dependent phosphoenolpyruvate carboxykinase
MILIAGTKYAGELKKSMFTVMNYYMPEAGRAVDALLGEHRQGRRHRALLRILGHGQDRRCPPIPERR